MPKISIIMPVYNAATFLERSIGALLAQTCKDIEIICINDGSTDNSLQILQHFASIDKRLVIIDQANAGPATARNKGLEKACGTYIMFCDADDWYEPEMCQKMLDAITQHDVDLAMCDANVVDEVESLDRGDAAAYYRIPNPQYTDLTTAAQKLRINVVIWSKIFKKSIIDQYQIKFPDGFMAHEDNAFVFQYLSASQKIFFLDEQLCNYFRGKNESLSVQYWQGRSTSVDRCKLAHFVFEKLQKNNLLEKNMLYFTEFYATQVQLCFLPLDPELHQEQFEIEHEFVKQNNILFNKRQYILQYIRDNNFAKFETPFRNCVSLDFWKRKRAIKLLINILTLGLIKGFRKQLKKTQDKVKELSRLKK